MAKRRSARSRQNRSFRRLLRNAVRRRHQHHPWRLHSAHGVRLIWPTRTLGKTEELRRNVQGLRTNVAALRREVRALNTVGTKEVAAGMGRLRAGAIMAGEAAKNLLATWHIMRPPILNDPPEEPDPWTRVR